MAVTGSETQPSLRRTVHLTVSPDQPPIAMSWRPSSLPHRSWRERVLLFAERAVGGLATRLWVALLILFGALVIVGVIAVFAGVFPALHGALVIGVFYVLGRK